MDKVKHVYNVQGTAINFGSAVVENPSKGIISAFPSLMSVALVTVHLHPCTTQLCIWPLLGKVNVMLNTLPSTSYRENSRIRSSMRTNLASRWGYRKSWAVERPWCPEYPLTWVCTSCRAEWPTASGIPFWRSDSRKTRRCRRRVAINRQEEKNLNDPAAMYTFNEL